MSREVVTSRAEPADEPEPAGAPDPVEAGPGAPGVPRRTFGARRVTRFTLLGLVAAGVLAGVAGRTVGGPDGTTGGGAGGGAGGGPALRARLEADPSAARPELAAELDRLGLTLVLSNPGRAQRAVDSVAVTGLGPVTDDLAPGTRLPAGGSVRVAITVTADCALLDRARTVILVDGVSIGAPLGEPRALLSRLCPPVVPGLAVDVAVARTSGPAGVDVRLVNHGGRTATVVAPQVAGAPTTLLSQPGLPLTLVPGQAATAHLTVVPTNCPTAGAAPASSASRPAGAPDVPWLEARMPQGYAPVGNWPVDLVRLADRSARADCGTP